MVKSTSTLWCNAILQYPDTLRLGGAKG